MGADNLLRPEIAIILRHQLEAYASDGCEAFTFSMTCSMQSSAACRRDQRFSHIRRQELELLLADIRANAARWLFNKLRNRVCLDDIDAADEVER